MNHDVSWVEEFFTEFFQRINTDIRQIFYVFIFWLLPRNSYYNTLKCPIVQQTITFHSIYEVKYILCQSGVLDVSMFVTKNFSNFC